MAPIATQRVLFNGVAGGPAAARWWRATPRHRAILRPQESDPGPHDDAEAAINPMDWQNLPTDHGNLGTLRASFSSRS